MNCQAEKGPFNDLSKILLCSWTMATLHTQATSTNKCLLFLNFVGLTGRVKHLPKEEAIELE